MQTKTKSVAQDYATSWNETPMPPQGPPQVGLVRVAKVVEETFPIVAGEGSIGQMVESILTESVKAGDQVATVSVNISGDLWRAMGGRTPVEL